MSVPRRLGVLGGTFDPVHVGHLVVASEVHHALALDEVVLVPAGRPWQKEHRVLAPAQDRVRMTELAVAEDPRLTVSRVDVDRDGPTYSIDTVRDLRRVHGASTEIFLVLGADALAGLAGWHRVDELLDEVVVVGVARPGHPITAPPGIDPERLQQVPVTALEVSSTAVRERVRAGAPIRYLVPEPVEQHIRDHGLYRSAA